MTPRYLEPKDAFLQLGEAELWNAYYAAEWIREEQAITANTRAQNILATMRFIGAAKGIKVEFGGLAQLYPLSPWENESIHDPKNQAEIVYQSRMSLYDICYNK